MNDETYAVTSEEVQRSYLATALWSSVVYAAHECDCTHCVANPGEQDHQQCDGAPADQFFSPEDLDHTSDAIQDLDSFMVEAREVIAENLEGDHIWSDETQIAHDFWLTRNGHGAGFWDRYSRGTKGAAVGRMLSELSKNYGGLDVWPVDANCFEIH